MADTVLTRVTAKEIFPSTKTQTINKLITENSLTRIINRLVDVESYVITSEFDNTIIETLKNANQEDYIPVTNMLNKDLEVCIRGYYFNLGTISDFITAYSNLGSTLGVAIYISDDTEYPELYGQEVLESISVSKGESTGNIQISDEYDSEYISDIKLYTTVDSVQQVLSLGTVTIGTSGLELVVEGSTNIQLVWGDNTIGGETYNIDKISFVYKISQDVISVFSVGDDNSFPANTGYKAHYLIVLQKFGNATWGIPLSSIHKFDTISISNIDGGVI